jgi:hypothetical protein
MHHEEKVAVESYDDALAYPVEAIDATACHCADRRLDRAQHEWVGDAYTLDDATTQERVQPLDVYRDVGKLGH